MLQSTKGVIFWNFIHTTTDSVEIEYETKREKYGDWKGNWKGTKGINQPWKGLYWMCKGMWKIIWKVTNKTWKGMCKGTTKTWKGTWKGTWRMRTLMCN